MGTRRHNPLAATCANREHRSPPAVLAATHPARAPLHSSPTRMQTTATPTPPRHFFKMMLTVLATSASALTPANGLFPLPAPVLPTSCTTIAFMSNFGDCDSYDKTNHAYCTQDVDILNQHCTAAVSCPTQCASVVVVPGSTCASIAFDAGYGACSTYTTINRPFCAVDKDMGLQSCTAANSCTECANAGNPLVKIDVADCSTIVYDAGFGLCDTYLRWPNRAYCDKDVDHFFNCKASDACKQCEEQPKEETKDCRSIVFNAGFGQCNTYSSTLPNNKFCLTDIDRIYDCTAAESCAECDKVSTDDCRTVPGQGFDAGYGPCTTYALSNKFHCLTDIDTTYKCTAAESCWQCDQTKSPTKEPTTAVPTTAVPTTAKPTLQPTGAPNEPTRAPTTAAPTNVPYTRWYMQNSPQSCDTWCGAQSAPNLKCVSTRMNQVTSGAILKGVQSAVVADQGASKAWSCFAGFGNGASSTIFEPSMLNGQCDPQSASQVSTCAARDWSIHRLCCCAGPTENAIEMCPITWSDCQSGTSLWDESTSRCLPKEFDCPPGTWRDETSQIVIICRLPATVAPTMIPTTAVPTEEPTTQRPTTQTPTTSKVSDLFAVTFHANPSHNLTRSPNMFDTQADDGRSDRGTDRTSNGKANGAHVCTDPQADGHSCHALPDARRSNERSRAAVDVRIQPRKPRGLWVRCGLHAFERCSPRVRQGDLERSSADV